MKLMTKETHASLPPLYSQEKEPDPPVLVKFFQPWGSWTWYAIEGSPIDEEGLPTSAEESVDYLFYGLVDGFEKEIGYWTLSDLESVNGPMGLKIERDLYWDPKPLSAVRGE